MRQRLYLTFAVMALCITGFFLPRIWNSTQTRTDEIVVTIKPLHSLVCSVAKGVFVPKLLLNGQTSPHTHTLLPSEISRLQKAKCVFWIGPSYEMDMAHVLKHQISSDRRMALMDAPGLDLKSVRTGDLWGNTCACTHEHTHHTLDGHIWLSLSNAAVMVDAICMHLIRMDPVHEQTYIKNAQDTKEQLIQLENEIKTLLKPILGTTYLIYHDAMQYFDHTFGTCAVGSIVQDIGANTQPKHLQALNNLLTSDQRPHMLLIEPNMHPKVVAHFVQKYNLKVQTIDYLGANIPEGHTAYGEIMRAMAHTLIGLSEFR